MDSRARRARTAVRSLGRRGLRERIPDSVRSGALAYVEAVRPQGRPCSEIEKTVGLSKSALGRVGAARRPPRQRLRPVKVSAPTEAIESSVAVVTPAGHRIEGLSLTDAVEVVRALG